MRSGAARHAPRGKAGPLVGTAVGMCTRDMPHTPLVSPRPWFRRQDERGAGDQPLPMSKYCKTAVVFYLLQPALGTFIMYQGQECGGTVPKCVGCI